MSKYKTLEKSGWVVRTYRAGFTLIELLIVVAIIAILAAIAIPNLLSSRKSANDASAIGSIRSINGAEATYRSRNSTYGRMIYLGNLLDYSLQNATTGARAKSGYYFRTRGVSSYQYYVVARPADTTSGDQEFYTDEAGTIFAAPDGTTFPASDQSGVPPDGFTQIGN